MLIQQIQERPVCSWVDDQNAVHIFDRHCLPAAQRQHSLPLYFKRGYLNASRRSCYFFILSRNQSGKILAGFQCTRENDQTWVSPPNAPFGGIHCFARCNDDELRCFLEVIKSWIREAGGRTMSIKSFPSSYFPVLHKKLHRGYISTGFEVKHTLANQHIFIGGKNQAANMHASARRRIAKCRRAGFASVLDTAITIEEAYHFIAACRQENGYPMPMQLEELQKQKDLFPEDMLVFVNRDKSLIISLIIGVRVNRRILYNFLSAYRRSYAAFSPVIQLTETVLDYCQKHSFHMLDLGTSLDHKSAEKHSLVRFKSRLGAAICEKNIYTIDLNH